ncbi:MAG: PIN domain-containing protein [Pseudomonadota bacterium]
MSHFAAVLDANVLYSYPLTSVLLELAEARLFRPIWSIDIHDEWMRALERNRPDIPREKLERRRAAMDAALPDACVTGYQRLIPAIELPDADDRHVLAAAIRAKAQVIVTFNEQDFPAATLDEFDLCTQHPDTFLRHLIDLAPGIVRARLLALIARLRNPPTSVDDYIAMLERQSLPESAAALRELLAGE